MTRFGITGSARDFGPLLPLSIVIVAVLILYAPTVAGIVELWNKSEYRHGALVLPISAYLVWRMRDKLAGIELAPWPPGLIAIGALAAVWLLSRWLDVQVSEQFAAVALIPAAVATFLGCAFARQLSFPLLFLLAAVPLGTGFLPALMVVTADISTALLRLTGVPVFRDGQVLALPGGNFEVADVCAGLNYLVSGIMIALLYAYLTFNSNFKRALFVTGTALVLILANGLRAFIVMAVASATDMRYLGGRDHVWFGWLLFGVVVTLLFLFGARWADEPEHETSLGGEDDMTGDAVTGRRHSALPLAFMLTGVMLAATAQRFQATLGSSWKLVLPAGALLLWILIRKYGGVGAVPKPTDTDRPAAAYGRSRRAAVLLGGLCLLAIGPLVLSAPPRVRVEATTFVEAPVVAECSRLAAPPAGFHAIALRADFAGLAAYACADRPVNAMLAGYWGTGSEREIHRLLPKSWLNSPTQTLAGFESATTAVRVRELRSPGRLAWYWYTVDGRPVHSALGVKLFEAFDLVRLREPQSRVYMLETMLDGDIAASRERLARAATAFWELALPQAPAEQVDRLTLRQ